MFCSPCISWDTIEIPWKMENLVCIHSLLQFCSLLCFLGGRRSLFLSISQALGPGLLKTGAFTFCLLSHHTPQPLFLQDNLLGRLEKNERCVEGSSGLYWCPFTCLGPCMQWHANSLCLEHAGSPASCSCGHSRKVPGVFFFPQ